ncbi:MAG: GNAT family N-acetyltransferase [Actinomycetota bacterium]|nr:GNAT family N-acetyltransferase [Actinomycetota bacterium]
MTAGDKIRIEPWGSGDLPLLERTMGDAAMTVYLGGPEDAANLAERQKKYEKLAGSGEGRMFKIVDIATGESLGSIGYWDKAWNGTTVYEIGWTVIPEAQGRGVATIATATALARAREDGNHRFVHAFPSVENLASNAICRKLGFEFLGEYDFEFPPGHWMRCNDWRLDLQDQPAAARLSAIQTEP